MPTVLDTLSIDAFPRFLTRVSGLRSICPALSTALVVANLTENTSGELTGAEQEALAEAERLLPAWSGRAFIAKSRIRHFTTLAQAAGRNVGYLTDTRYVRPAFDALGREIETHLGAQL